MAIITEFLPLNEGDLTLGEPAPFDCYGENKTLMLKAGTVVKSSHLEKLIGYGFRVDDTPPPDVELIRTPFQRIDDFKTRLQKIFTDIQAQDKPSNLQARIIKLCEDVQKLWEQDACAALGAVHLNYGGRHSIDHPVHVALICELIGQAKDIPHEQRISILAASLTCNIGMLKYHDALHRQETPLAKEQKDDVRAHPLKSVALLAEIGVADGTWLKTVKHHHEKLNGAGYPAGLSGENVTLPVRILALADSYCSMLTSRSYRQSMTAQESLRLLLTKRSADIDPALAQLLVKKLTLYPPGAFVRLVNGEKALVIRRGEGVMTPKVKSYTAPNGVPLKVVVLRDCSNKDYAIKEMLPRDKDFKLGLEELWDYIG